MNIFIEGFFDLNCPIASLTLDFRTAALQLPLQFSHNLITAIVGLKSMLHCRSALDENDSLTQFVFSNKCVQLTHTDSVLSSVQIGIDVSNEFQYAVVIFANSLCR